jgi:dTDP-4-amino-4,6-dideoxygalactose transaminase
MPINFIDLARQKAALEPRMSQAVAEALDGIAFIGGPQVKAFEAELSNWMGGCHVVACANGTDALQIPLRASGIGPGDAVAVPSLTFCATTEAVLLAGAMPVFIDTDETGTMCPHSLQRAVEAGLRGDLPKLTAVMPVDLFAIPADHAAIGAIAAANGMLHFVDTAHSIGSGAADGLCGLHGLASGTSFYPSKALGGYGDGGAMFTHDTEMARKMRGIANHGVQAGIDGHSLIGTNSRLDTLQAAVLRVKLSVFTEEIATRRRVGQRYFDELADVVTLPDIPAGATPCWSYFCIRHRDRDGLQKHLAAQGIGSVAYYKVPTHLHPVYAGYAQAPGGLPRTMDFADRLLCLPMHPYLTEDEVSQVTAAVRAFGA